MYRLSLMLQLDKLRYALLISPDGVECRSFEVTSGHTWIRAASILPGTFDDQCSTKRRHLGHLLQRERTLLATSSLLSWNSGFGAASVSLVEASKPVESHGNGDVVQEPSTFLRSLWLQKNWYNYFVDGLTETPTPVQPGKGRSFQVRHVCCEL